MDGKERLDSFLDALGCGSPLGHWVYNEAGELLSSTYPYAHIFEAVLRSAGALEAIPTSGNGPMLYGVEYGISWIGAVDTEKQLHLLGPFFAGEIKPIDLEGLYYHIAGKASASWQKAFREAVEALPIVPLSIYRQIALSLYYLLTGQRVGVEDIRYIVPRQEVPGDFSNLPTHKPVKDRREIYWAERAVLHAVREGDMEGAAAMERAAEIGKVRLYTNDPLRNVQIACTTFVTLCVRAAIEGGLSTTLSYGLGDAYIKSIFQARSAAEVSSIKNQMYRDFITRVHAIRKNPSYSKMVQSSCDYIELHLAEPLNIEVLSSRLGYAKYYLSTQFKKETGTSVNDYIKYVRVERAKVLLATTDQSVEDIAEAVGFTSRSFFANTFKKCVGMTPVEYRRQRQSI